MYTVQQRLYSYAKAEMFLDKSGLAGRMTLSLAY